MTTTMADGRPTDPTGARPAPLVLRPHRPQARRFIRIQLGAGALVVPSSIYLLTRNDGWEAVYQGVFLTYWIGFVLSQVFVMARLIGADALLEVGPQGIRLNDLGRGWVTLPWDAVGSVRKNLWGQLVVTPADGVGPTTPGTDWPPGTSTARRARRGFKLPSRVADPDAADVLEAVHHFSGGRL